jgi:hypothetical protein
MAAILNRLEKLEARFAPPERLQNAFRFISDPKIHGDETTEECIRRNGYDPDQLNALFIIRRIVTPA